VDHRQLSDWVARYESAWRAPGSESLAGLFADDATYSTAPYETPHRGLESIRVMWEAERSDGEEFAMQSEIVAVDGDTGVVRVQIDYRKPRPQQFRDLWVVRLDGTGRCIHFEEWPFWPPGAAGAPGAGAGA
jgi:ketosteroid isomerase-like protein